MGASLVEEQRKAVGSGRDFAGEASKCLEDGVGFAVNILQRGRGSRGGRGGEARNGRRRDWCLGEGALELGAEGGGLISLRGSKSLSRAERWDGCPGLGFVAEERVQNLRPASLLDLLPLRPCVCTASPLFLPVRC